MKKSVFLLLVGGISAACAAQIKSIKFEGLRHLSPQVAQQISGLKVGDQITGENTDAAISNLFAQGYFSDVYISEQSGAVTINVTEKPTIAKVEIKNVVTNDRDKIRSSSVCARDRFTTRWPSKKRRRVSNNTTKSRAFSTPWWNFIQSRSMRTSRSSC